MEFSDLPNQVMVPSQWADLYRSRARDGNTRLWLAVLEDALLCISGKAVGSHTFGIRYRRYRDAWGWVEDRAVCPGSFEFVCEALGIEPEHLRNRLLQWKERPNLTRIPRRSPAITNEKVSAAK